MDLGNSNKLFSGKTPVEPPSRPCGVYNGMSAQVLPGMYQAQLQLPPFPPQHQMMPVQLPMQQGMPPLALEYPAAGAAAALTPSQQGAQMVPGGQQVPITVQSTLFTPGFLKTQIGRRMRVEFLIGTGALIDRTGTLLSVGVSYILLRLVDSDDIMMCDIYSIKFVTILL